MSLLSVAQRCPPNFTGADIYALCADAWFHAAKRSVSISAPMCCDLSVFRFKHLKLILQEVTRPALKKSLLISLILWR
jgi:hypothetical protein